MHSGKYTAEWGLFIFHHITITSRMGALFHYTLWPHRLQHARLPCPSPTPRACSISCPCCQWCHPTISSCHPCLLFPSNFPASGSFPMGQFFASSGQSIGVLASTSVLPMNIQDCKLQVVKQEMARVNINILGISELRWTGMGEFNSDDYYIYYCGQ